MKKTNKISLIICILLICVFTFTPFWKSNKNNSIKEVDIYNVVKEVFLTEKGYSNELSKHVSKDVFEQTNIYNVYNVNDSDYKRPFKVDFSLKDDSQSMEKNIVYVEMVYSVKITDSQNKVVGGSWDIPITFTVKETEGDWYIIKKCEPA